MKKLCDECGKTTKWEKKYVGFDRPSFFTMENIAFAIFTLGFSVLYFIFFEKTKYYDIYCRECNLGYEKVTLGEFGLD